MTLRFSIILTIYSIIFFSCSSDDRTENSIIDADGNHYDTVRIFEQVWLRQNLKTTHYNNGDPIDLIKDNIKWGNTKSGAYCNINNMDSLKKRFGLLYNFYAILDSRGIAPKGYHVATLEDWQKLICSFEGSACYAGGHLKLPGTDLWGIPNSIVENQYSEFEALPTGYRSSSGDFLLNPYNNKCEEDNCERNLEYCQQTCEYTTCRRSNCLWTSTKSMKGTKSWCCDRIATTNEENAFHIMLYSNNNSAWVIPDEYSKGFAIRCVKD